MTIRPNRSEYCAHADLRRIARAVYVAPRAPSYSETRKRQRASDRRIARVHAAVERIATAAAYAGLVVAGCAFAFCAGLAATVGAA